MIAIGIFLIYWAQTHPPLDSIDSIVDSALDSFSGDDPYSYNMSEPWYYTCLGLGILVGILGLLRTYKSMK